MRGVGDNFSVGIHLGSARDRIGQLPGDDHKGRGTRTRVGDRVVKLLVLLLDPGRALSRNAGQVVGSGIELRADPRLGPIDPRKLTPVIRSAVVQHIVPARISHLRVTVETRQSGKRTVDAIVATTRLRRPTVVDQTTVRMPRRVGADLVVAVRKFEAELQIILVRRILEGRQMVRTVLPRTFKRRKVRSYRPGSRKGLIQPVSTVLGGSGPIEIPTTIRTQTGRPARQIAVRFSSLGSGVDVNLNVSRSAVARSTRRVRSSSSSRYRIVSAAFG